MEITFDRQKRALTLASRGLDFLDAAKVFEGVVAIEEDTRFVYPERRFLAAGELDGRMVVIVWTETERGRRIISMRHCHADEERYWRERVG